MYKRFFTVIMLPLIFLSVSCTSNPVYISKGYIDIKNSKIAVLSFRDFNKNEGNNSGHLIRSLFELKMSEKGFKIVDIEKVSSSIDYPAIDKGEYTSEWIIKAGRDTGADYLLFGAVHDYRIYQSKTSFLYLFEWLEITGSVGVTARMVSCKTGEVVWSGSFTHTSYTLNDAAAEVVTTLIQTMRYRLN